MAVGLDAAKETTMRYNWKLDEFVATILITGINVETLGTRLRISPCGTWKVRTRSCPCDAKTTRKQTVWFASSTAIERGRDARYGCVGFLLFSRNCSMQWWRPKLPRSWACTVWSTCSGSVSPLVPSWKTDFTRVWTGSIACSRRRNETLRQSVFQLAVLVQSVEV